MGICEPKRLRKDRPNYRTLDLFKPVPSQTVPATVLKNRSQRSRPAGVCNVPPKVAEGPHSPKESKSEAVGGSGPTIQARFIAYHQRHPEVYARIKELAHIDLSRYSAGRIKHLSISRIYETIRSEFYTTPSGEPYVFSNDFRSRYARLLLEDMPELNGILKTRGLTTE